MKHQTRLTVLLLILLMALFLPTASASAAGNVPIDCPPGYELHHYMTHEGDHMHRDIGVNFDLNGDGLLCMKELPNGAHLHIDNALHRH